MKYLTVKELSEKWNVTTRRIQKLCAENRIDGAIRFGHSWAIPDTAVKPTDRRVRTKKETKLNIEQIMNDYGIYIYNFALRLSGNVKDAEDLTQDTFIKVWQHIQELKDYRAIKKWIRTICLNEYKMRLKKENRLKIINSDSLEDLENNGNLLKSPSLTLNDEIIVSDEVAKLRDGCFFAMTNRLTFNQRIAFSLIDMLGLSINEASEILDTTPKAIKGLLYRARMNLEAFFNKHCSILNTDNACQCLAWKDFVEQRSDIQNNLRAELGDLDFKNSNYTYIESTRQKILYYYRNMPEQKPDEKWFLDTINAVSNFFKENEKKRDFSQKS